MKSFWSSTEENSLLTQESINSWASTIHRWKERIWSKQSGIESRWRYRVTHKKRKEKVKKERNTRSETWQKSKSIAMDRQNERRGGKCMLLGGHSMGLVCTTPPPPTDLVPGDTESETSKCFSCSYSHNCTCIPSTVLHLHTDTHAHLFTHCFWWLYMFWSSRIHIYTHSCSIPSLCLAWCLAPLLLPRNS